MVSSLTVGALIIIALGIGIVVCDIMVQACFIGAMNIMDLISNCIIILFLLAEFIAISMNGEKMYRSCTITLFVNGVLFIVYLIHIIFNIFFISGEDG